MSVEYDGLERKKGKEMPMGTPGSGSAVTHGRRERCCRAQKKESAGAHKEGVIAHDERGRCRHAR